jgi:hypothetical protein
MPIFEKQFLKFNDEYMKCWLRAVKIIGEYYGLLGITRDKLGIN